MSDKEEHSNFFFNGLMMGGIIGGVLGVLFAPWKGEEVREKLKQKVDEMNLDSDKTLGEIKEKSEQMLEGAKHSLMGALDRISSAIEEGKKAAQEKAADLEEDSEIGLEEEKE